MLERFKTAFKQLDTASDFKTFSVSNTNNSAINVSTSALAKPGSHSIEVQSIAQGSERNHVSLPSKPEINGGEPFAIRISTREQPLIWLSRLSPPAVSNYRCLVVTIALAAGDSAATVAAKVKEALEADGSSL